mmetsp:Transcript_37320/g.48289  ORF Transcript_37320/g.48289 Transcript_37320/m.48289 type:complete len:96 (-) Transcript_37320:540-827(-)
MPPTPHHWQLATTTNNLPPPLLDRDHTWSVNDVSLRYNTYSTTNSNEGFYSLLWPIRREEAVVLSFALFHFFGFVWSMMRMKLEKKMKLTGISFV